MNRAPTSLIRMIAAALASAGASLASAQSTRVWTDLSTDAAPRRTDLGNAAAILPGANLPDIQSITIGGWSPTNPTADAFTGSFVAAAGAHIFRLDVVFKGLVNPPGPISSSPGSHAPTLFGPSPLYLNVELDADADANTGGETSLTDTYLGQAARFASRPQSLGARAIASATDSVADCFTEPFFRRTGAEFSLNLCGCFAPALVSQTGNMDDVMQPGEIFIVRGPFFIRTSGYQDASFAFGGFFPGTYDPQSDLRFSHNSATDTTKVSVVFPLTMHGYAILNGLPNDPPANFDVADAHSVFEALADVISYCNANNLFGCVAPIAQAWEGRSAGDYLNVTTWGASALAGTTYADPPASGFYVWTDIGFDALYKDVNGDGSVSSADRTAVQDYIALYDGDFFEDEDFTVDGSVHVRWFGFYYSMFDINYDGVVNATDVSMFPNICPANWDGIGGVDTSDFFAFISDFFELQADFNGDGTTNTADFFAFMGAFFQGCP